MERAGLEKLVMNKRNKIAAARVLRKNQTEAEEKLWWLLRNRYFLGYKFRRQYICRGFIIDFYSPSARLGIELDGPIHRLRKDYDRARDEIITSTGIKLLRINNEELNKRPVAAMQKIIKHLPALPSPLWGEGGPSRRDGG
jgi:very-short-patch-repair endonuclease